MGDLVTDGPTVTVKLDVNMMTDISHPLTFPVITTTMCVGAKCFSFWCFLSRENRIMATAGGLSQSPTLIFIQVTLGRVCTLSKSFLFYFLWGGQLQQKSILVDDVRSSDSWEPTALHQHCLLLGI